MPKVPQQEFAVEEERTGKVVVFLFLFVNGECELLETQIDSFW
jgi:hypothetical protein